MACVVRPLAIPQLMAKPAATHADGLAKPIQSPKSQFGTTIPERKHLPPMNVVARSKLEEFWKRYPDAEQPLKAWYEEATKADWATPQAIKDQYRSASFRPDRRVVFNIKGNDYRLVVAVAYQFKAVYIKFIGTHAEHDAINVDTVQPE